MGSSRLPRRRRPELDGPGVPSRSAVDGEGLAHRALDVKALDVVPVLLQKRHQEVDGHQTVLSQLVGIHVHVTNGYAHAQDLLQLELDHAADLRHLVLQSVAVLNHGREFASLVQTWSEQTRDLRDENLRRDERVEGLSQLLDQLLVLVQLLQVLHALVRHAGTLSLLTVHGVSKDADLHSGTRHVRELDGAGEALVALRVVVLEADLKLDGLQELPRLLLRPLEDLRDALLQGLNVELAHCGSLVAATAAQWDSPRKPNLNLSR